MPQRSNEFQRLVLLLHKTFAGKATVTESKMLPDRQSKKGVLREVDIYIESTVAGYTTRISVEAEAKSRKANVNFVEQKAKKHETLPTDRLILVSEKGFTESALEKAASLGIEAVTIEKALAADWDTAASIGETGYFARTKLKYVTFVHVIWRDGQRVRGQVPPSFLFRKMGQPAASVATFLNYLFGLAETKAALLQVTAGTPINFSIEIPRGEATCQIEDEEMEVVGFEFDVEFEEVKTPIRFRSGKFKEQSFLSGVSDDTSKLEFVMVKQEDGSSKGTLTVGDGIFLTLVGKPS